MTLDLSTISVDVDSIRAIRWNIDESGIKCDDRKIETRVYWRRTYIYFKNISDCLTLDDCNAAGEANPDYETDVEKLKQAWEQRSV